MLLFLLIFSFMSFTLELWLLYFGHIVMFCIVLFPPPSNVGTLLYWYNSLIQYINLFWLWHCICSIFSFPFVYLHAGIIIIIIMLSITFIFSYIFLEFETRCLLGFFILFNYSTTARIAMCACYLPHVSSSGWFYRCL